MKQMGAKMRSLREGIGFSQMKLAEVLETTQSSINRYEHGLSVPSVEFLRKFADYFDISLDYLFSRCDAPQGKLYEVKPPKTYSNPEINQFIEMCFDPDSSMNARLKETLVKMLQGESK